MWPCGLVEATMGGPSEGHKESFNLGGGRSHSQEHLDLTCPESQRADWSPLLSKAHQCFVQSDVVNNDEACCRADTDDVHSRTLGNKVFITEMGFRNKTSALWEETLEGTCCSAVTPADQPGNMNNSLLRRKQTSSC